MSRSRLQPTSGPFPADRWRTTCPPETFRRCLSVLAIVLTCERAPLQYRDGGHRQAPAGIPLLVFPSLSRFGPSPKSVSTALFAANTDPRASRVRMPAGLLSTNVLSCSSARMRSACSWRLRITDTTKRPAMEYAIKAKANRSAVSKLEWGFSNSRRSVAQTTARPIIDRGVRTRAARHHRQNV